jgi:hypothetical protein
VIGIKKLGIFRQDKKTITLILKHLLTEWFYIDLTILDIDIYRL